MRVFRRYRCENGHEWAIERHDSEGEAPNDVICPQGHEAVTCFTEYPVDDPQIAILPAARIVDAVKLQRILDDRYRIALLDKSGNELCRSDKNYSWDEAIKLAGLFRGKSLEQTIKWWQRKKP